MHIASIGTGPVVLLLHGFPELWYSWRHQLLYLSSVGYRAIAPDLRGFGDTDAPESHTVYTPFHIVGDLVGALDELGIEKVFVVGHDWGAIIAWYLCLFRPDRVKALVNLSVHFLRRNPTISFVQGFRIAFGDDFYICRFQVISISNYISVSSKFLFFLSPYNSLCCLYYILNFNQTLKHTTVFILNLSVLFSKRNNFISNQSF